MLTCFFLLLLLLLFEVKLLLLYLVLVRPEFGEFRFNLLQVSNGFGFGLNGLLGFETEVLFPLPELLFCFVLGAANTAGIVGWLVNLTTARKDC